MGLEKRGKGGLWSGGKEVSLSLSLSLSKQVLKRIDEVLSLALAEGDSYSSLPLQPDPCFVFMHSVLFGVLGGQPGDGISVSVRSHLHVCAPGTRVTDK